ncbi:MAG TPA: hypothetical protein VF092_23390 [Longimicrobium sp.]
MSRVDIQLERAILAPPSALVIRSGRLGFAFVSPSASTGGMSRRPARVDLMEKHGFVSRIELYTTLSKAFKNRGHPGKFIRLLWFDLACKMNAYRGISRLCRRIPAQERLVFSA